MRSAIVIPAFTRRTCSTSMPSTPMSSPSPRRSRCSAVLADRCAVRCAVRGVQWRFAVCRSRCAVRGVQWRFAVCRSRCAVAVRGVPLPGAGAATRVLLPRPDSARRGTSSSPTGRTPRCRGRAGASRSTRATDPSEVLGPRAPGGGGSTAGRSCARRSRVAAAGGDGRPAAIPVCRFGGRGTVVRPWRVRAGVPLDRAIAEIEWRCARFSTAVAGRRLRWDEPCPIMLRNEKLVRTF
jgi:hypothetical protein